MAEEIEWFVGIDWASQSHQVCLVDARGEWLGERAVAHGGPGIEELCDWLIARTGATPEVIGVAIEMTQGPVVEALLERGFCVYGINPKQLDRFRDRFTVAGAKDDRRDAHRLRRWQAPEVLRILKQKPLSVAPGVVEAASDHIRTLTVRIRLVNQQLKAAHRKLDELCAQLIPSEEDEPGQRCEQRDVVILRSMPGLGRIILAVLLAEVWQPLRRRDYHALRSLSGVAPVTRRSGKTSVVVRRYACNKRLANALYHWARLATQRDALSRRRYAALRQRGHSHGRALRTIADPLLSVACTLLEQQTLFDPEYEVRDAAGA